MSIKMARAIIDLEAKVKHLESLEPALREFELRLTAMEERAALAGPDERLDQAEKRISWLLARIPADTPPANGMYADGIDFAAAQNVVKRGPGRPRKDKSDQPAA